VSKPAAESTLARLVDMVASAEARKSPDQRFTTKLERRFVPIVLAAAPLLSIGLFATGTPVKDAVLRGLALLVAASPCALAVATPSAVLSAVARAARSGVLIKGGSDLHALGNVRAIAFDKTGTLTRGEPRLVEIVGDDKPLLLTTSAGAEALSAHPLARAVLTGAAERGLQPGRGDHLVATHGKGIRATVDGVAVAVGRADWLAPLPANISAAVDRMEAAGQTTLVVQRAGVILGVLGVADTLRTEAKDALASLTTMGLDRTVMLSGDNARVAGSIAKQVGITEARAPLLPEEKLIAVRDLARHGGVAMVGDGVNDAPALAAASVGVTLGGAGSDVALQTADVVLMGDDLRRLPFAVALARAANDTVRWNIRIALGVAAVLIVASITGQVGISHAVVLHEGSTLVVVLNGLRLLGWRGRG
jgi:Cd2+/Zn2+-exporting ATPase